MIFVSLLRKRPIRAVEQGSSSFKISEIVFHTTISNTEHLLSGEYTLDKASFRETLSVAFA